VTITKTDIDLIAVGKPGDVRIQAPAGADIAVQVAGGAKDVDIVGFTIVGGQRRHPVRHALRFAGVRIRLRLGHRRHRIRLRPSRHRGDRDGHARGGRPRHCPRTGNGQQQRSDRHSDQRRGSWRGSRGTSWAATLGNSTNEGVGILIFQTSNVEVEHNVVFGNDEGILLAAFTGGAHVTHTEVEDNRSFNNTFNGIGLVNADNNEIEGNKLSFNGFRRHQRRQRSERIRTPCPAPRPATSSGEMRPRSTGGPASSWNPRLPATP